MKMIRTPIPHRQRMFLGFCSIFLIVVSYIFVAMYQQKINPDNTTIPGAKLFVEGFKNIFSPRIDRLYGPDGTTEFLTFFKSWFWVDIVASGSRFLIAMAISITLAVSLGLLMGCFAKIEAFFNWPLAFFSKVTPTGALSVFFVLFGTDTKMFVAMIVFGIAPSLAISVMLGVKQMAEQLIQKGYTLGASTSELVLSIVWRWVLPNVIDAIRLCVGPAIIFLIAAESLCADSGFGYRILMQAKLTNMNTVFIYLAFLAGFGFIADWGLKVLQRKLCKWYGDNRNV